MKKEKDIKQVAIPAFEWKLRMASICRCTQSELKKIMGSKETDVADVMLAKIVLIAIETGDHKRLDFILDRTIGKVKESLEVKTPTPVIIKRKSGEEVELGSVVKGKDDE